MGPEHAGKIIDMINDNTAAENWTERSRHRLAKVDQVLSIMGLSELLLKQTVVGSRVKTKDNFADTGTRMERGRDFREPGTCCPRGHTWLGSCAGTGPRLVATDGLGHPLQGSPLP